MRLVLPRRREASRRRHPAPSGGRPGSALHQEGSGMTAGAAPREVRERTGIDWLRVPGLGRFLRWRHVRVVLQLPLFAAALALIAHGFLGPQLSPKNLATVVTWVQYRGALVLVLLVSGNLFCMACPFML